MNEFPGSEDEEMRRLLDDAVSGIEPAETLDSIRSRTAATPLHSRRPWIWAAGAAVVATAATVTAVTAMGGGPGSTGTADPGFAGGASGVPSARPSDASAMPSAPPSNGGVVDPAAPPSTTGPLSGVASDVPGTDPSTAKMTVPAYYVGDTFAGLRLFREFVSVPQGPDTAVRSAFAAVQGHPSDPDYRNAWDKVPAGEYDGAGVVSVTEGDGTITVDLSSDGADLRTRPAGMSADEAEMAVQQVVYSVQAAAQRRDPVRFLIRGAHTDTLLGVPTAEPLPQGDPNDVLAQVWIIDPAEGTTVHRRFDVYGVANAFEANVQWELMQGQRVVRKGSTMAEEAMTMAPYGFPVNDVPPGDYTLVVHDEDASGRGHQWQDTKDIRVR